MNGRQRLGRVVRAIVPVLLASSLAGCALSPAPVDHYYRLRIGPVDHRFESPLMPGTLRVKRPRTEALTDGTHLIFREKDNPAEVHRDPYQFWTDAPSLIVRDVLIDAFHSSQIAERIVAPGLRAPVDFTLSSRIVKMERIVSGISESVHFDIEFSLLREQDRQLIFHERYADRENVIGTGAAEAVGAYDRVIARILESLLRDLEQALSQDGAEFAAWHR